ncbi:LIM/homeobox protein Lhx9 [Salmo salar]|uniref:LIM/homeobox protein Lhx9 n=1 Tax=Salmo salar TaxID=8030 RepID=A0A1S3M227_SALSA|nr:LIM/homeobox protein Lhx9 [Salmo salar]XP_013997186.1 LIM/homeobox protein Lhx9 [Salmo salar]|eukprot:XP_013997185.1 PREDICTED: LIM/homeobox protein Lhx9-like [Salmo salar]
MMSPEDSSTMEGLLYGSLHGDEGEESVNQGSRRLGEDNSTASSPATGLVEEPLVCAGCEGRVCDRFVLLAAGRAWHEACLRCSQCQCELQTHLTLFCRDGSIYCQQDYCRLFSVGRCARCSQPIPSSAMVMRSGDLTFHPECFSCQECDVTLMPGNLYSQQGQSLYCQSHYHDDCSAPPSHKLHLKQREGEGEESVSSPEPRLEDGVTGGRARRRTKRIRTCFRSEQLRAMESYFALKHNPDGKDWSCLSHRTGLPKRVLQVWFQNARAKLRRSLSADESQSNSPAPQRFDTMATASPSLVTSSHQSQSFQTSTIDQLELSLLTAPLSDPPQSPADQSAGFKDSFFLDYNSQGAPRLSPLMTYNFGESGLEREGDSDTVLQPYY